MDKAEFRLERITKLLHELKYELERGWVEGDIDETITFEFVHPISRAIPDGVIRARFEARPTPGYLLSDQGPRLKLVKS